MILAIDGCFKKLQILVALLKICKFVIRYFPFLLYMHHLKVFKYFILFLKIKYWRNANFVFLFFLFFSNFISNCFWKIKYRKDANFVFLFCIQVYSKMERFTWHLKISLFTFTNCSLLGNILPLSLSLIINKF